MARLVYHTCLENGRYNNIFSSKIIYGQIPAFILQLLYFLIFLSQLNKKKKRESGQKNRKPALILRFFKPGFVLKSGFKTQKNWAKI